MTYANRYSENDSDVSDIIYRNCCIHACAHMHEFILINYLLYFYIGGACHAMCDEIPSGIVEFELAKSVGVKKGRGGGGSSTIYARHAGSRRGSAP